MMIRLLVATCFASLIGVAYGQAGANDPSFNPLDVVYEHNGPNNTLLAITPQTDGKILIGGSFTSYRDSTRNHITRLNSDGSLDFSFSAAATTDAYVSCIAVQPDGKILIGGGFSNCNGQMRKHIARLNSDGTLDMSFNPGTGANGKVKKMIIQPDGNILIVGEFTSYGGVARHYVARIDNVGGLDTGFDPGTGTTSPVIAACLQPDGKLVIGGNFVSFNGTSTGRCARINSDGSLDESFISGTGANWEVDGLALQNDGKVIAVGMFTYFNGTSTNYLVRLNSDGSLDSGFSTGTGANVPLSAVMAQPDGKDLIAGLFSSYNFVPTQQYARLNSDGTLDLSFSPANVYGSNIPIIVAQADGKFLLGGELQTIGETRRLGLARFNNDGSLDHEFNKVNSVNSPISVMQVQPDGKILIAGSFHTYKEVQRRGIARLDPDGDLDTTFATGTGTGGGGSVYCMFLQPDGKILIGGFFDSYNGTPRGNIARINSDGSLDNTFATGVGVSGTISAIIQLANGKVLIAGEFYAYDGVMRSGFTQLNSDGSLDLDFNANQGFGGPVRAIAPLADGRILVGGTLFGNGSGQLGCLAMLDALGYISPFGTGAGQAGSVWNILVQPDGKFLVSGQISSYDGVPLNNMARINSDGSLDPTFQAGSGPDDLVLSMVLQANGSIVIGGYFGQYDGTERERIARIHADGSLDPVFDPGTGTTVGFVEDPFVDALAIQPDGRIVIGGDFLEYNGAIRTGLARTLVEDDIGISELAPPNALLIAPNPATDRLQLSDVDNASRWSIRDMEGRLLLQGDMLPTVECSIDVSDLASGSYLLTVQDGATRRTAHLDKL